MAERFSHGGPTISILLANYNDGRYLRESLEGIFGQSDPADEVVVVDDGSSDDSVAIIESFLPRHGNARLIRHERNLGQHAAISRALEAARSEYVAWAASDDLLLPQFVERNRRALAANPGIGLSFSRLCAWRDGTGEVNDFSAPRYAEWFSLGTEATCYSPQALRERVRRRYLWISGNTVVARRDALLAAGGFDTRLRWHADWFAFYAIALRHGACAIPEILARMRERDATYSRAGMHDRAAQRAVLRTLIDVLHEPANRDLLAAFRECPTLLTPFGRYLLYANFWRPQSWPLVMPAFGSLLGYKLRERRAARQA